MLAVTSIVSSTFAVAANPGPYIGAHYDGTGDALLTTFVYNFPVNLVWFCIALLAVCKVFGDRVGGISRQTLRFLGLTVAAVVIVTTLGSLIDYTLLLAEYPFGYVLYYDLLNWTAAAGLIFVSIYFSSLLLLNLNLKVSLIPAAAITILNPIWWKAGGGEDMFSFARMTLIAAIILAPIVLAALWVWHRRSFPPGRPG